MFAKNGEDKLSGDELNKCPGLKAGLSRLDPAGTGVVTAHMIAEHIAAWHATNLGRMRISCHVYHNGQPLPGAEVKFVPEPFLGTEIKTASGVTNANGVAWISAPQRQPNDAPGVPPGYYRVEISKPGLAIPAKYNTDTIFGAEVASDARELRARGLEFDLKF